VVHLGEEVGRLNDGKAGSGRGQVQRLPRCFEARCPKKGNVIDLGAALHGLGLRDAALDLVNTFDLEPAPVKGTEKKDG
jgi:hypothetical protein